MKGKVVKTLLVSLLLSFATFSFGQEGNIAPGAQIRNLLITELESGDELNNASSEVSDQVLQSGLFFDANGFSYLQENETAYRNMVRLLNENATGFELTIAGFSEMPDVPTQVVTIALIFFPEEANEIYNVSQQMQMLNEDDALLAAINAGIDPSTLTATAAGAAPTQVAPLGVGTGAAGAGGGDTTISAN